MQRVGPALEEVYASLYRYARALCGDPVEAEELAQEACRRALASRETPPLDSEARMRAWVFRIARNAWLNEIRRKRRRPAEELPEDDLLRAHADTPEVLLSRRLLQSEVREAIDALPESYREVIVLRELEDLSYDEIAAVIDAPRGTVMSRLSRGRERLRRVLLGFSPVGREASS